MLHREKHQLIMGRILRAIYSDVSIASLLGLKGGTCAYFFYGLPRFSVDLDFDLLDEGGGRQKFIFETVQKILGGHGEIKDSHIKLNTIFFLLSYGSADHNIKIEISTRLPTPNLRDHYELLEYLGIPMLVAKKPHLFAGKLAALTLRSRPAMRDIYDIWFFATNNWDIDVETVTILAGKNVKKHLADCIALIEGVKDNQILHGLGELLNEREKIWVKNHLRNEAMFLLKNYLSVLK